MESIIKKIYKERYNNNANSRSLAKALNLLIGSIFSDPARILYELLQNADDAVQLNADKISYNIYLLDSHLVINYNGKAFDKSDVQSLCSVGASSKVSINNKIGYKGIGFKSVFSISDCVWIVSDGNCFRFDKHYQSQETNSYPWQIIPIWTNVGMLPQEVKAENGIKEKIDANGITIILKIKSQEDDIEKIRTNLNTIYANHKMILFLRNVKEITCFKKKGPNLKQVLQVTREDDNGRRTRKIEVQRGENPLECHRYLVHEFAQDIPPLVQMSLQDLPDKDCPEKLKTATQTQITLAVPLDNKEAIKPKEYSSIYCYLPTSIKKRIPYHINAEFLTSPDRSKFYKTNTWNDWLFEQIGYQQFEWIREIVENGYFKCQIPTLIRGEYSLVKNDWDFSIKKAFNKGLINAKSNVAFLPEYNSKNLAFISESVVDKTTYSFSSKEEEELVKDEVKRHYNIEKPKIIDPDIENLDKIISLGAKEFNVELLCGLFGSQRYTKFINPVDNEKLIHFFTLTIGRLESEEDRNKWNEALSKTDFLLTDTLTLRAPSDLYFTADGFDLNLIPKMLSPSFLNEEVYHSLLSSPLAKDWLKDIQVKKISIVELLKREVIEQLSEDGFLTNTNVVELTRFIFNHFSQLEDSSKQKIKNTLKVLTKNNHLVPAKDTYLADAYNPPLCIEALGTSVEIVSEDYVENKGKANEFGKWNSFFSEMYVQKQMKLKPCKEKMNIRSILQIGPYANDYISYLKEEFNTGLLEVKHLFYVTFAEELANVAFAELFWDRLLNSEVLTTIMQKEQKVIAFVGKAKQKENVPSLFRYYIQNNKSFPTLHGGCLPTTEVYSYHLKEWWEDYKPIAAHKMPSEIEDYLGIRNTLKLKDHLALLAEFSEVEPAVLHHKIGRVYLEMAMNIRLYTSEQKAQIRRWGIENKLLADDNTFQVASNLHFFDIEKFTAPQKSKRFLKIIGNIGEDLKTDFCRLFGVKVVQRTDLKAEKEGEVIDDSLKNRLKTLAFALAYDFIRANGGDVEEKREKLVDKINRTTFYECENIYLAYRNNEEQLIYEAPILSWQEENSVYFKRHWADIDVMYDLIPKLCVYLGLNDREREVQLMLFLSQERLKEWLSFQGVNTEIIEQIDIGGDTENYVSEPLATYSTLSGKDIIEQMQQQTKSTKEADAKTGRKGELFVYTDLVQKYENSPEAYVTWVNKEGESKKPYDIILEVAGETTYIDVKTTSSDATTLMYMSKEEYHFMNENNDCYKLYRVSEINNKPSIVVLTFDDLIGLVFEGGYVLRVV